MRHRRLGCFRISEHVLEENLDSVQKVMAMCVIINCDYDRCTRVFEYAAISEHFDEVDEGMKGPLYHVVITSLEDGSETVSFEKSDFVENRHKLIR